MHKLIFTLLIAAQTLTVSAQNPHRTGQVLVQFAQNERAAVASARLVSPKRNIWLIECDSTQTNETELLAEYRAAPNVVWAQLNHIVQYRNDTDGIPNDPLFDKQWNMERIGMTQVWQHFTGGLTAQNDTIVVAIIDTGCDLDHEDLRPQIWRNTHETPDDGIDNDQNGYTDDYFGWRVNTQTDGHADAGHGSMIAGIIGATGNNSRGVSGVNQHIKLMIISGAALESEIVEAIDYIIAARTKFNQTNGNEGAFVVAVNMSFGWNNAHPDQYPLFCAALDDLGAAGIISVAATANNAVDVDVVGDVPTGCISPYLVAVTATTTADGRRTSAAYGAQSVDLGAPGEYIQSTYSNNSYDEGNGTSFATPHVAGAVGLLYSLPSNDLALEAISEPAQTAQKVRQAILTGAKPIFALKNITTTGGRLDVWRAAGALRNTYGMPWAEISRADTAAAAVFFEQANVSANGNSLYIQFGTNQYLPLGITLTDLTGRTLLTYTTTDADYFAPYIVVPTPNLPTGIYIAYLQNGQQIACKKIAILR